MIYQQYHCNEGFDMETDNCIDIGEEWEVFSIIISTQLIFNYTRRITIWKQKK